ncbi:MAG: hypothetical protein H8E01_00245, partial [Chloroflexi bacterium]|nr:hypothetical protein [Chloroflexota bacterium]
IGVRGAWADVPTALAAKPGHASAATLVVTSTADSGPGTLRQAMLDAVSGDTITFDPAVFSPGSPVTIMLTSVELPEVTQGSLTIDGTGAGVILDGSAQPHNHGFNITSDGNVIKGLQILNFPANGILVTDGASDNTIADNVISGNAQWGVEMWGLDTMSNTVIGNLIGTNASGTDALGNGFGGVGIYEGARYNTIGGDTPEERNVISGNNGDNRGDGVIIYGSGTDHNTVSGNYIGIDITGATAIPNRGHGVGIGNGASYSIVGGDASGARNVISGNNDTAGVRIFDSGTSHNVVSGNYIGTNINGTAAIPNPSGVSIEQGAQYNTVGGSTPGERNLISGNDYVGVWIFGSSTDNNVVIGNYIGTDASGTAAIGNGHYGVALEDGAAYNTIGGSAPGERNIISGNHPAGVSVAWGAEHNTVRGNYIGTDVNGTTTLPNDGYGVQVGQGATDNVIGGSNGAPGGPCTGDCNLISGNSDAALTFEDSGTERNVCSGNYIGTDVSGTTPIPNEAGIHVFNGASNNTIGGDTAGERNLISSNGWIGVHIEGSGTMSNTVSGNYIGLDLDGARQAFPADVAISPDYPNDCTLYVATLSTGVHKSTDCGDTWAEVNNGLTESRLMQVEIPPDATDADTVYALAENGYLFVTTDGGANWSLVSTRLEGIDRRNLVLSAGFTSDQTMYASAEWWSWWELGDGPGVFKSTDGGVTWTRMVNGMSDDHVWKVIASPDPAEKETLFALTHSGIEKSNDGGENWSTVPSPDSDLSDLALSPAYASDQTVFVTANTGRVYSSTDGGGSWSGVDALRGDPRFLALSPDYPNDQTVCHGGGWNDRIYCSTDGGVTWTQTDTRLPGWLDDAGTGIAFSPDYPTDPTMFVISVAGMSRSTDGGTTWQLVRGLRDLGNTTGVSIGGGATYNAIGPDNVISNNHFGVTINDDGSAYNVIAGNLIGTDPTGTFVQANSDTGVSIWGGHHNLIGGETADERNIISGNGGYDHPGVSIEGSGTVSNTVSGNYIGTDASGTAAIGNVGKGFYGGDINKGARHKNIGGGGPGERNGNSGNGKEGGTWGNETRRNTLHGN